MPRHMAAICVPVSTTHSHVHFSNIIAAPSQAVFDAPRDTSSGHHFLGHWDVCAILIHILASYVDWLV